MNELLKRIKIGDLVLFKVKYEDLDAEYCIGFIQNIDDKCFTISQYAERITFLMMAQFESLVHYKDIDEFQILKKPEEVKK